MTEKALKELLQLINQKAEPVNNRHAHKHKDGFAKVEQDIDNADALRFRFRADGTDNGGRHAVAQINAHDNGVNGLKGEQSRRGERLQNAHGGGGALQKERHARARDVAQKGIVPKPGEHALDNAGFRQRIDGACHVEQSRKEDSEADGNASGGLRVLDATAH